MASKRIAKRETQEAASAVSSIKDVPESAAPTETTSTEEVNITKLARKLVQASSMRLQLQKIEEECKEKLLAEMNSKGLKTFEVKTTVNGRPITLTGEITESTQTSVDIEKLTALITPEQFQQCAKVSLKDAKEVLPGGLIQQCTSTTKGNPTLKVKAKGSIVVPDVQFY